MEREGSESTIQLLRAIRSLTHNRRLRPLVEERIERAEATIRSQLLLRGTSETQIGPYEVKVDSSDEISITRLSVDEWQQMPLSLVEASDGIFDRAIQTMNTARATIGAERNWEITGDAHNRH